jgi:hypothetical protein
MVRNFKELENTAFWKMDLFSCSGERKETLCVLYLCRISDDGRSP